MFLKTLQQKTNDISVFAKTTRELKQFCLKIVFENVNDNIRIRSTEQILEEAQIYFDWIMKGKDEELKNISYR